MSETASEITFKLAREFAPVAEMMLKEGASQADIDRALKNHLGMKARANIRQAVKTVQNIKPYLERIMNGIGLEIASAETADSMTEVVLYNHLKNSGVKFSFQREIGHYCVDFLIGGLIVEVDGPCHKQRVARDQIRDKYLRKMGYSIMRVPAALVTEAPEEVVRAIIKRTGG